MHICILSAVYTCRALYINTTDVTYILHNISNIDAISFPIIGQTIGSPDRCFVFIINIFLNIIMVVFGYFKSVGKVSDQ